MGAITQAMARAAGGQGVRIDVGSTVREILVERSRAVGVVLEDGRPVRARAIAANVDPQQLFQALLPQEVVPPTVAARMKRWKAGSGTFRIARQSLAPLDLERIFGLPNGDIFHGALTLGQAVVRRGQIVFVASRAIKPGEELTYNYGHEYFDYFLKSSGCRCTSCRGKMDARNRKNPARRKR
jgi:phytoene dehydrogenase-like protein